MAHGGARPGAGRRKGARNKATREISEMAREFCPAALTELGRLATKAESEAARVQAIGMLMDRGYGKPSQAIKHSGSVGSYDLTRVSDADLDRLEAILGPLAVSDGDQG